MSPGPVVAWVAGGVAAGVMILVAALLLARSDAPSRRLADLISAWRR
jgi:hypothetical protein